ncbi:hypothetical protein HETIRDRAFT_426345 [Heterobasidion irregulare TC 32-1]|uniref:Endonuclease/exonuclease/phosphatase domain-containing protein n=1 Tax=Heterobasidion irregulare (strain TC 32-1) TaxID=747525 RepID=W4KAJ8_HETIT|nr:uncharacterized protein HETIRDRAFT_426345 [Heterobasidion irregulare TC 32-1]ETW82842.1 hypothetical protein HETIRDRAFT_426345 [Heterobasidion irregulare TC 32-1]
MKGQAATTLGPSPISKWAEISNLMKKNRIGVLALQETHLMDKHLDEIHKLHGRQILVLNSSMGTNMGGVAFVLNREITNTQNIEMTTIVPGQALLITLMWHQTSKVTLLNIYAPNDYESHPLFWDTIRTQILNTNARPDIMLGDFNLVEDPIDRAPARPDSEEATTALRKLRSALNLQDEWQHTFPTTRQFTFRSHTETMSRLDRIYAETSHQTYLFQWSSGLTNVPTDHDMVSINSLKKDLATAANESNIDTNLGARMNEAILHSELDYLEKKRRSNARSKAQAQWSYKGETISKYWSKINSAKKPREIIQRLHIPNSSPPKYTSNSIEMVDIVRNYHNKIQNNPQTSQQMQTDNDRICQDVLREIPETQKLQNAENSPLNNLVSKQEVERAIQAAKTGSVAGMDRIPYELWKALAIRHKATQNKNKEVPSFNIVQTLTIVY